jgi:hypothetical protein
MDKTTDLTGIELLALVAAGPGLYDTASFVSGASSMCARR